MGEISWIAFSVIICYNMAYFLPKYHNTSEGKGRTTVKENNFFHPSSKETVLRMINLDKVQNGKFPGDVAADR